MTPYKPAFGPRVRRQFPFLAAEDTNHLFQAFRERRLRGGNYLRRLKWWFGGVAMGITPLRILLAVGALVILVVLFAVFGCLVFLFIAPVAALAQRGVYRRRIEGGYLPMRLGDVFLRGAMELPATDLYLAGSTGRLIVEAIILEHFEGVFRTTAWSLGLLGATAIGVVAYAALASGSWGLAPMLTLVSIAVLSYVLAQAVYRGRTDTVGRKMESLILSWSRRVLTPGTLMAERLGGAVVSALLHLLYIGAAVVVGIVLGHVLEVLGPPGSALGQHLQTSAGWHIATYILLAASGMLLLGNLFDRRGRKLIANVVEGADYCFDHFMASVVLADPDGEAWARWRHAPAEGQRTKDKGQVGGEQAADGG